MRIAGFDFTSAPGRDKPIVTALCCRDGGALRLERFLEFRDWPAMLRRCASLGKAAFVERAMAAFRTPGGQKNRLTDTAARSNSPLKTRANPPVGLMFYEGAWRLMVHGVDVPGLRETGSARVALEAFPRLLVERLGVSRGAYKNDRPRSVAANAAVQADWALDRRTQRYGLPRSNDPVEGWIVSA